MAAMCKFTAITSTVNQRNVVSVGTWWAPLNLTYLHLIIPQAHRAARRATGLHEPLASLSPAEARNMSLAAARSLAEPRVRCDGGQCGPRPRSTGVGGASRHAARGAGSGPGRGGGAAVVLRGASAGLLAGSVRGLACRWGGGSDGARGTTVTRALGSGDAPGVEAAVRRSTTSSRLAAPPAESSRVSWRASVGERLAARRGEDGEAAADGAAAGARGVARGSRLPSR